MKDGHSSWKNGRDMLSRWYFKTSMCHSSNMWPSRFLPKLIRKDKQRCVSLNKGIGHRKNPVHRCTRQILLCVKIQINLNPAIMNNLSVLRNKYFFLTKWLKWHHSQTDFPDSYRMFWSNTTEYIFPQPMEFPVKYSISQDIKEVLTNTGKLKWLLILSLSTMEWNQNSITRKTINFTQTCGDWPACYWMMYGHQRNQEGKVLNTIIE